MNVTGIVFTNDASLGELTTKRTMASLPFGGRYRQEDWALSNLACAGVRHIGIISRHNYQSLMNHIGDGEEWGLELEEGGLEFLTPYAQSEVHRYRGKLESLASAMDFLAYGSDDELVIMTDSAILSNIDLTKVIAAHVKSGRNITVVTKAGICNGEKMIDLAMKLDGKGNVTDMLVDFAAPADYVASMDIFVVDKKWLMQQTREMIAQVPHGSRPCSGWLAAGQGFRQCLPVRRCRPVQRVRGGIFQKLHGAHRPGHPPRHVRRQSSHLHQGS